MFTKKIDYDKFFPQESTEKIAKEKETEFYKLYSEIKDKNFITQISQETRAMIPQIDQRVHYWEDRRTLFLQISLGITAAALAGIIAIASEADNIITNFFSLSTFVYVPIFSFCLALVIGGVAILAVWNKQNNPNYPFTKAIKIWRWHYRFAENKPSTINEYEFSPQLYVDEVYKSVENFSEYKKRLLQSNSQELLDQDISQLYLLLTNEKFKIKYVDQLKNSLFLFLKIGYFSIGVSILLLGIVFAIFS